MDRLFPRGCSANALAVTRDEFRSGAVAIVGRPNVGKSTLMNAALDQPLAIVSSTPQTTRDELLGVVHYKNVEMAFLDTPGLHLPRTELGKRMNASAREATRKADVVLFVAEVPLSRSAAALAPHPGDRVLLQGLTTDAPVVLVLNKVDRIRDKSRLLPLIEAFSKLRTFASITPVSLLKNTEVSRILDEVARLCPLGQWRFGDDDITDKPLRYFAREYVREQILRSTQAEVPHASAVSIDKFDETPKGDLSIDATIHVERSGQKKILVGKGAEMLKNIGISARKRLEELAGCKVHMRLWVRVTPTWRMNPSTLDELGYGHEKS